MRVIYSLSEIEQLLAEETARRTGYEGEATPAFTASVVTLDDEEETQGVLVVMAVPEDEIPVVPEDEVKSVSGPTKARGGARAGAGRKRGR